jgi:hypothetical protein
MSEVLFFCFDFVWFLRVFLIVVVAGEKKRKLYYVRNMCESFDLCVAHTVLTRAVVVVLSLLVITL